MSYLLFGERRRKAFWFTPQTGSAEGAVCLPSKQKVGCSNHGCDRQVVTPQNLHIRFIMNGLK